MKSHLATIALNPHIEAHQTLDSLLQTVRACRVCEAHLPLGPRPVLQASAKAKILIVGQAPGAKVHVSGVPWDDRSGVRLRGWMGIDAPIFYDRSCVAIVPMGYCYPGRGASGDLPPRRECAPLWLDRLLALLPQVELTLLVGRIRPAKSSCCSEVAQGCSCPRHFIADTWTLQESSCRAGGHGGGMCRSSESRLYRRAGSLACRSQPLHWPTA